MTGMSGKGDAEVALSPAGRAARQGDPDRFEAALFEDDVRRRERLFTLIALNLELARTRLKVSEPHLGLIRLQWWRDVVAAAADGATPRAHELGAPLANMIQNAPRLLAQEVAGLIDARERDLEEDPFAGFDALHAYLDGTAGAMMRASALALTPEAEDSETRSALSALAGADGAARFLAATPMLAAEGRVVLPMAPAGRRALLRGETAEELLAAVQELAGWGLQRLIAGRTAWRALAAPRRRVLKPVALSAWRAERVLRAAVRPDVDPFKDLGPESLFRRRTSLLWRGFFRSL